MALGSFDPKYLLPLIVHQTHRNRAIGVTNTLSGFLGDMIYMYWGYLDDKGFYENVLAFQKLTIDNKLEKLREYIHQARSEPDLAERKILLINALELSQELGRLTYDDEK